jgi:adenosylhomocysteine nucleosidase
VRIGIVSAMQEENNLFVKKIAFHDEQVKGRRTYTTGEFCGHDVVLVFSRWGKVAGAITATHLIADYKVDALIFTGTAASCDPKLHIGDIIIGSILVQHDMDASPIFPKHEIPLIGVSEFKADPFWTEKANRAANSFLESSFFSLEREQLLEFGVEVPKVHQGLIVSGDKFFSCQEDLQQLKIGLPETLCVEMEGAAVAQVCHEYGIPYTIIRTISDGGKENSAEQFQRFVNSIASRYSLGILEELFLKK